MYIDCDACQVRGPACTDCVVTVLLGAPPDAVPASGVDLDTAEQAAIAVLAGAGLVPPLRLVRADEDEEEALEAEWFDPPIDTPHHRSARRGTDPSSAGLRRGSPEPPSDRRSVSPPPDRRRDVS